MATQHEGAGIRTHQGPLTVDPERLAGFERGLDPAHPERSVIPPRILGYGEISTVFEIPQPETRGLAFKRLAIFRTQQEIDDYQQVYWDYCELMETGAGLRLPPHTTVRVAGRGGHPILYIVQQEVDPATLAHHALQSLPPQALLGAIRQVLGEIIMVAAFNDDHPDRCLGIDGQLSNWSLDPSWVARPEGPPPSPPLYLDTSTPLLRRQGVEGLNPELFLRTAPSFLVWILRWLFLREVMERYYHVRDVFLDLTANLYKEGRPDLIPDVLELVNANLVRLPASRPAAPLGADEVRTYYSRDAFIWSLFLRLRRIDRSLCRLRGRRYEYILPGRIRR
jgi:hypothetical protein